MREVSMRKVLFALALLVAVAGGVAITSSAQADDNQGKCTTSDCR